MVCNIRLLKKFREYFMDLKAAGVGNSFEIEILQQYFPIIATPTSYLRFNDPIQDPLNLQRLMAQVNTKINSPERPAIVELYTQIFALN